MHLIISTMKDEGPFILEWIAYYQSIGFDHFIISTNDCSDGTDKIISRLQDLGIATHIDNPGPWEIGPQAAAYEKAMAHPKYEQAEWVMVCDADEFLDIKVGDHTLDALFDASPKANVFAFIWRLFGHNGVVDFEDKFVTDQFTMAAPALQVLPQQNRALKTLFRNNGVYRIASTHRPKRPYPKREKELYWVDGSGQKMPGYDRQDWTFSLTGVGYGDAIARMNHYAVRSIDSYLMKRMRGDVNTTSFHQKMEETGQAYWRLHCWNAVEDQSIRAKIPRARVFYEKLLEDTALTDLHKGAVAFHKQRIAALRETERAKSFISQYADYRHDEITLMKDVSICDDRAIYTAEQFKPETFIKSMQIIRYQEMRKRLLVRNLPWFANCDALETSTDKQTVQRVLNRFAAKAETRFSTLPPLPKELTAVLNTPRKPPTPRQERQSRKRVTFLKTFAARSKRTWLLIGGRDEQIIDDLLSLPDLETLFVIEPWGMREAELVVPDQNIDEKRKEQDAKFFRTIMRFQDQIKKGRLRIFRAPPLSVLKLFEDGFFDVAFLNGGRRSRPVKDLLLMLDQKVRPGGTILTNTYWHQRDSSRDMIAAVHEYLGNDDRAQSHRIQSLNPPYIAVERLKP